MMLGLEAVYNSIRAQGIDLFAGVPDSLLKNFCAYIVDHVPPDNHVITANEGNAIALASGEYLATGKPALVYMQNSGLGNAINPLLSLADAEVYSLPMLLMIGWRGEPGIKDEPQHIKQGRVMTAMLDAMEIPWFELSANALDSDDVIERACRLMREKSQPVALLVRKNTFEPYSSLERSVSSYSMSREAAVRCVVDLLDENDIVVSTTGQASRELYEYREAMQMGHNSDFLTVGAMGHATSIAMGISRGRPERRVVCLDGDGAFVMHMGALAIIGQSGLNNLVHVVINNGAHDSVGGQPTVGFGIDLVAIAQACGYTLAMAASSPEEVEQAFSHLLVAKGPTLLEIRVHRGTRDNLGRPALTPIQNRTALMTQLAVRAAQ